MIQSEKRENEAILKKSADFLKEKGYEQIKIDLEGYDSPTAFKQRQSEISYTPDIVAFRGGKKHFFEVSLKSDKTRSLKSKWLLLNTLSELRNTHFKIITTQGHFKFTKDLLSELNLEKKLIRI